jgi:hypothetical protein
MKPRAGEWVKVRTKKEILKTLDANGRLGNLPFMPEMFQFCGKEFRVYKRAHKTCDTVSGPSSGYVARRLPDTVHLELRCDGKAHGGCQAACLLFWKEAWLEPTENTRTTEYGDGSGQGDRPATGSVGCSEENVWNATHAPCSSSSSERYVCQATELPEFTEPLKWWDARQYIEDYHSGNIPISSMIRTFLYALVYYGTLANKGRLGHPTRKIYDIGRKFIGARPMSRARGRIRHGVLTPTNNLELRAGDLVRVRPFEDILNTIDERNLNRGLYFDAEMVPFCGKTFRVRTRVERFIDESTGRMKGLKTPAVILEGAYCRACYSEHRFFCPRAIFSWWREIWLEKIVDSSES